MKNKKVFLKTIYCLAVLLLIASIGFNVFQYQRNKRFLDKQSSVKITEKESISEASSDSEAAPVRLVQKSTTLVSENTSNTSEIDELEHELDVVEEEIGDVNEELYDELVKKEAFRNAANQLQKNILENPAFKESIRNSLIQNIDRDYALLYERLDLSPDELDAFKSIVADWREANVERAALINTASSPEEKEEAYRQRQEARDKYNNEFIDLMGEEKFRIYDDFKNRNSERSFPRPERFHEVLDSLRQMNRARWVTYWRTRKGI